MKELIVPDILLEELAKGDVDLLTVVLSRRTKNHMHVGIHEAIASQELADAIGTLVEEACEATAGH